MKTVLTSGRLVVETRSWRIAAPEATTFIDTHGVFCAAHSVEVVEFFEPGSLREVTRMNVTVRGIAIAAGGRARSRHMAWVRPVVDGTVLKAELPGWLTGVLESLEATQRELV